MAWKALILMTVLSATLIGCDGRPPTGVDEEPPAPGGPIISTDSLVVLNIPPGTVPPGTSIVIEDATETAPLVAVGRVYTIGPAGTQFTSPATLALTLPFDPAEIWDSVTGHDLSLARLEGERWSPLETTYDPARHTLTAEIEHLSTFGAVYVRRVPYSVSDEEPTWLWADEWVGHVSRSAHLEEGAVPPGPYHLRQVVGFMGLLEEEADSPVVVFSERAAAWRDGTVFWVPAVPARLAIGEVRVPSPDHTCPAITTARGLASTEIGQVEPSGETRMTVDARESSYRIHFSQAPGQSVPVEFEAWCIVDWEETEKNYIIEAGIMDKEVDAFHGSVSQPLPAGPVPLVGVEPVGSGPATVRVTWGLVPQYDVTGWRTAYRTELASRPRYGTRLEMWAEIDAECQRGERSGIICRAAHRALRDSEQAYLTPWVDDCQRIQDIVLHRTHAPLVSSTDVFDASIVEGPVDFCRRTHDFLLSFVHPYVSGSLPVFQQRLPAELRQLYSLFDLDRLF